jgi:hypothetical protein
MAKPVIMFNISMWISMVCLGILVVSLTQSCELNPTKIITEPNKTLNTISAVGFICGLMTAAFCKVKSKEIK